MYGTLTRLNDLVKQFDFLPLAMSDESMGSTGQFAKNAMMKRISLALAQEKISFSKASSLLNKNIEDIRESSLI
jgi:hypothetical protein